MQIEITNEERDVLVELLQTAHREILHEIHHTDTHDYKELLRKKVVVIESLKGKIQPVPQ